MKPQSFKPTVKHSGGNIQFWECFWTPVLNLLHPDQGDVPRDMLHTLV